MKNCSNHKDKGKSKSGKGKRIRRPPTEQQEGRFALIKKLVKQGKSIAQIAPELGLTKARTGQIIANMRKRGMIVTSKAKVGRPKNEP